MENLSIFSLIDEKVKKYKDDFALDEPGAAFIYLSLDVILNLNSDEIIDAVTDGSMDGGVDAIYINGRDVHVFNFKYTSSFENSKKNFPETEMDKLIVTMERIYGKSLVKSDVNDALWDKVSEIWSLFEQGSLKFTYYFCSNKAKPTPDAQRKFEVYMDKFRHVDYRYIDQELFASMILDNKYKKVDGALSFIDKQYFERSDARLKGVVATISAEDLISLVADKDDPSKINENVFNDNVRVYLKLKNRINRGIYETALSEANYEFWYLNNGVTIVCNECDYIPNTRSPRVSLKNFQIVNGGQTTNALFEAYQVNKDQIGNVLLLVRICETKDDTISEKISETTNSQNPVRSRDLHSNDRIQRRLEEQFLCKSYYYERKRSQYSGESKEKRLDSELLGQLYMAFYLKKASEARNQKSIVFGECYEEIFNEDTTTADDMLIPYNIYLPLQAKKQEIQLKKRKKESVEEKDAFISRATFHILMGVGIIGRHRNITSWDKETIDGTLDESISIINDLVEETMQKRGGTYTHDKFFKEKPTNRLVEEHFLNKLACTANQAS